MRVLTKLNPSPLKDPQLPHDHRRDRQPYLNEAQAESLMTDILDKYLKTRLGGTRTRPS